MRIAVVPIAVLLATLSGAAGLAMADRAPTPEERTRIMQALKDLGFDSAGEIEIEGRRVEVENALHQDGRRYELKLDAQTLEVISKEEEDEDED
jgi:hypothetical protein